MSEEPDEGPTSPQSRETLRLLGTSSFVERLPDPNSSRARRISDRQVRLGSHEPQSRPPSRAVSVDLDIERTLTKPVSRKKKTRQTSEEPSTSTAPPPKKMKLGASARSSSSRDDTEVTPVAKKKRGRKKKVDKEREEREREEREQEEQEEPAEEAEESRPKVEPPLSRKERNTLRSGIVPIQVVFNDKKRRPTKREQDETLEMFKELYPGVREEYDKAVAAELSDEYLQHAGCVGDDNKFRKSLPLTEEQIPAWRVGPIRENRIGYHTRVSFVKPEVNERGRKRVKVASSRIEVGDVRPGMTYWVPIEQSITTKDRRRLTHLPYFEDDQDDDKINEQMYNVFPEGIHGTGNNWEYINDWILYKMMRKVLGVFTGHPDLLYFTLYRLWPNKLTQTELSAEFPKLCARFAESDFDASAVEPWKPKPVQQVAKNLIGEIECYGCLSHMCPVHGFMKDVAPNFPGGEFYRVTVPLVSPSDEDHCSEECWKTVDPHEVRKQLKPTDGELSNGEVVVYINKLTQVKKEAETGLLMTAFGLSSYDLPFCEFAAKNVDMDDDSLRIRTCRAAYELVLTEVERPSEARLRMSILGKQDDFQKRTQRFRRYHYAQNKEKGKQRESELFMKAMEQGSDVRKLIAEDDKNKHTDAPIDVVSPLVGCHHNGSCETAEDCSCRANGVCSYLCRCDVNCKHRFPGCNCAPGSCQTKACQCFRIRWECNPLTCKQCNCGDHDTQLTRCSNFSMTRLVSKRLVVAPSRISGNGLFLLEGAEKDEFITEYVGERITDDEAERRGAIYDRYETSYIFNLSTGGAIDSYNVGNLSRFANHDKKNPTLYARTMVVAGEHRIGFCAKYKLEPNTELTFDYSYSGEHQKIFKRGTLKAGKKRKTLNAENAGTCP